MVCVAACLQAEMTPAEQKRHHRVRGHMQARRQRKASKKALLDAEKVANVPLSGVNLRDVGAVAQGPLQIGRVFRSSELLRYDGHPPQSLTPHKLCARTSTEPDLSAAARRKCG